MARIRVGLLAPAHDRQALILWNGMFEAAKIDAFFDLYKTEPCTCPACTKKTCLTLRLSEMFLLDRRGYIVDPVFQEKIVPLLDACDSSVNISKRANVVKNIDGRLIGFHIESIDEQYACMFDTPLPEAAKLFLERQIATQ